MHLKHALTATLGLSLPILSLASPLTSRNTSIVIPPECDVIPIWTVTTFLWYNSTHNLDCVTGPDIGDGTTCIAPSNTSSSGIETCDPSYQTCSSCGIGACYTGLPFVPLGYGPPDNVTIDIENGYTCLQTNPSTIRRYEVGEGYVACGGAGTYLFFYGDSNEESSTGHIDVTPTYACTNGSGIQPQLSVDFAVTCTHDEGFNATCTAELPFVIPVVGYTIL